MRLILLFVAAILVTACNQGELERLKDENSDLQSRLSVAEEENRQLKEDMVKLRENFNQLQFLSSQMEGIQARLVTTLGQIEIKFYNDLAPIHCFNFITRAESGFYDNTQFHRVMPDFMIQGGDPNSRDGDPYDDGQGGPIMNIPHEFNDTAHQPGILSMARIPDVSAGAGCQFFIMHGTAKHLDGQYTAFGEVTSGMDVVDAIAQRRTYGRSKPRLVNHPVDPVRILRVELFKAED